MVNTIEQVAQGLLDCVSDALSLDLRPVCKSYHSVGTPVILTCCDCGDEANGELSIHFRRVFDAEASSLGEVIRVRPCKGGVTAAQFRVVLARCTPTIDEMGELPESAAITDSAYDLMRDTELVWQALACCSDARIDDLSVDLGPTGGCRVIYADITAQVGIPALPIDTSL